MIKFCLAPSILKFYVLVHVLIFASRASHANSNEATQSFYEPRSDSAVTRSDIAMPLVSFVLPGTGQWAGGQYGYGSLYSSVAIGGVIYANTNTPENSASSDTQRVDAQGVTERKQNLGLQTYQSMGGFSLYHTFRSSVSLRQKKGQYLFLKATETPLDLALAPFHFTYLKRASTWIPLATGAFLNLWMARNPPNGWSRELVKSHDVAFASAFSWNAATHEEAVFRGWMMPAFREYWMNDEWANGSQAAIFAAAHLNSAPLPIAQLILGWHLGRVTQTNQWALGESIFIHAWWDVMAFMTIYSLKEDEKPSQPVRLHLPPVQFQF